MKTSLNPESLYWVSFNRFELRLTGQCAMDCLHQGPCDADVAHWAPLVWRQVEQDAFYNKLTADAIRAELKEYGAWDADELADDAENWLRLVWIAASNLAECESPDCSEPTLPNLKS